MAGKRSPRRVYKIVTAYADGHQRTRTYLTRKAADARVEREVQMGAVSIAWHHGVVTYADEPAYSLLADADLPPLEATP